MKTLAAGLIMAIAALGQESQPSVTNASFESRAFAGDLAAVLRSDAPRWFGYEVKAAVTGDGKCCWGNGSGYGCGLEGNPSVIANAAGKLQPIELEGSSRIEVLFRVEGGTVQKVQTYSLRCPLDAGGLPFVWLTGVSGDTSLRYLQTLAKNSVDRVANGAIFAISRHDGPQAVDVLVSLTKTGSTSHERSQALFWLAQRAGQKATAAITDAIENDPDTKVKRQAVFALSQLPNNEGIPKLLDVAQTQKNPEVRKQAFFWLGQSHDPRAIAFFQAVLSK